MAFARVHMPLIVACCAAASCPSATSVYLEVDGDYQSPAQADALEVRVLHREEPLWTRTIELTADQGLAQSLRILPGSHSASRLELEVVLRSRGGVVHRVLRPLRFREGQEVRERVCLPRWCAHSPALECVHGDCDAAAPDGDGDLDQDWDADTGPDADPDGADSDLDADSDDDIIGADGDRHDADTADADADHDEDMPCRLHTQDEIAAILDAQTVPGIGQNGQDTGQIIPVLDVAARFLLIDGTDALIEADQVTLDWVGDEPTVLAVMDINGLGDETPWENEGQDWTSAGVLVRHATVAGPEVNPTFALWPGAVLEDFNVVIVADNGLFQEDYGAPDDHELAPNLVLPFGRVKEVLLELGSCR